MNLKIHSHSGFTGFVDADSSMYTLGNLESAVGCEARLLVLGH